MQTLGTGPMLWLLLEVNFLMPFGLLTVGLVSAPTRHAKITPLFVWYVRYMMLVYFFLCGDARGSQHPRPFRIPTLGFF